MGLVIECLYILNSNQKSQKHYKERGTTLQKSFCMGNTTQQQRRFGEFFFSLHESVHKRPRTLTSSLKHGAPLSSYLAIMLRLYRG